MSTSPKQIPKSSAIPSSDNIQVESPHQNQQLPQLPQPPTEPNLDDIHCIHSGLPPVSTSIADAVDTFAICLDKHILAHALEQLKAEELALSRTQDALSRLEFSESARAAEVQKRLNEAANVINKAKATWRIVNTNISDDNQSLPDDDDDLSLPNSVLPSRAASRNHQSRLPSSSHHILQTDPLDGDTNNQQQQHMVHPRSTSEPGPHDDDHQNISSQPFSSDNPIFVDCVNEHQTQARLNISNNPIDIQQNDVPSPSPNIHSRLPTQFDTRNCQSHQNHDDHIRPNNANEQIIHQDTNNELLPHNSANRPVQSDHQADTPIQNQNSFRYNSMVEIRRPKTSAVTRTVPVDGKRVGKRRSSRK